MSILNTINTKLIAARKLKDAEKTTFYGTVLARVKILEKGESKKELTDEVVVGVLKKLIKETEETKEAADKGNRSDLLRSSIAELNALEDLIPNEFKDISTEQLYDTIKGIVAGIPEDQRKKAMGIVMKELKEKFGNRFDGKTASAMVKEILA